MSKYCNFQNESNFPLVSHVHILKLREIPSPWDFGCILHLQHIKSTKRVMYLSDVQTTEIASVALKFLQAKNNKYLCSEKWMPAHRHCLPFYLFDACREQKQSRAGEWAQSLRKKERSLCKHHWRKEVYIFMFSTHRYTHTMLYYIYANLLVTFLRKVGKSE